MTDLLTITTSHAGTEVVSARELYEYLGFDKSQWARWAKKNILNNPYAMENTDWVGFDIVSNGNQTTDYALSVDFAERLSMLARTEKGEEIRRWFQSIKNRVLAIGAAQTTALVPVSGGDMETARMLLRQAQLLMDQQQQINQLRDEVSQIRQGQKPPRLAPASTQAITDTGNQMALRQTVVRQVNEIADQRNVLHRDVYNWVYKQFQSIYGVDVHRLPRTNKENVLDALQRAGYLERILGILSAQLSYVEQ